MSTTALAGPPIQSRLDSEPCSEARMVARLVTTVARAGVWADPASIVNCYVALKSKPLTILVGPERGGKVQIIRFLTQMLTRDMWRNQKMLGHAWWAERSKDAALFVEAQTRLNSSKILALVEEASLPENADRVFIGWLQRISPAELAGFFSDLAFQLQHKRLMRLPSFHLTEPVLYPPNVSLLGTMDIASFGWPDENLLSQTTVIPWAAVEPKPPADQRPLGSFIPDVEQLFLRSSIRSEEAAFDKLHRIQGWRPQAMSPLWAVEDLLRQHQVVLPQSVMGEAVIYVANAWSAGGEGLFDPAPARNLTVALDFAITQSLLMRASEAIRDLPTLWAQLAGALNIRFLHSMAFLQILQDGEDRETVVHRRHVLQAPANPAPPLPLPKSTAPVADAAAHAAVDAALSHSR